MQAARGTALTGPGAPADGASDQPADSGEPVRGDLPARHRRVGILIATAVIVLGLDITSKLLVVANLSDRAPVRLLGGFLHLLVSRNPGAAFSIGTSMTVVFSVIAVGVIVVILRTSRRIRSVPWALTLGLLLGGATGNLLDRIFRSPGLFRGYVVDWIELPHWPVFNLADSAIVCGGILAVLLSARGIGLDGLRGSAEPSGTARDTEPGDAPLSQNGGGTGPVSAGTDPAPGDDVTSPPARDDAAAADAGGAPRPPVRGDQPADGRPADGGAG